MPDPKNTPGEQMSPNQIDPWMKQVPQRAAPPPPETAAPQDPVAAQEPPLGYETAAGADAAEASSPPQVEAEWHPPELSEKKIDKTRDLPHARKYEH